MKAILYARYSPRPRKGADLIETQHRDCGQWCESRSWQVISRHSDAGKSGALDVAERPGLAAALAQVKPGTVLVCRNANRLARDALVAIAIDREIHRLGGRVTYIEDGGLQDDTPQGRLFRGMRYLFSEYEREEINARTRRRFRQKQNDGQCVGAVPWGKKRVGNELHDNPEEITALQYMQEWKRRGKSLRQIANLLTNLGLTPRGGTWHRGTIARLLKKSESK